MTDLSRDLALTGRLLDAAALREQAAAANIAHASTPGWRRVDVRFDEAFRAALEAGGPAQAARVEPVVVREAGPARLDGNGVELERELALLARQALVYETLTRAADAKVALLRAAITGR